MSYSKKMNKVVALLVIVQCSIFVPSCLARNKNQICELLTVNTTYGKVRGKILTTEGARKNYYAFKGIPYARPPVGNLRFAPPLPPKKWTGIWKADKDANQCLQGIKAEGSEDCLYINVYTPKIGTGNLPVMVWIYGGYFMSGESSIHYFGPDYLIDEDVLVVTFNYRLGVFGFLSTEDEVAPGNYALKDQILALKWVKENIVNFGGDPESITIFGESAGAASVSYLVQTTLTKGLFHKAIMQSGTTLSLWSLSRKPSKIATSIAEALKVNISDSRSLVEGLRQIDATRLQVTSTAKDFLETITSNARDGLFFGPTTEIDHKGAVITKRSHEMLKRGYYNHVPIIVGYNSREGKLFMTVLDHFKLYLSQYDKNPKNLIPIDMNLNVDEETERKIGETIREKFFGNQSVAFSEDKLIDFLSSDQFVRPTNEYVRLLSQRDLVFFYRFSYEGALGDPERTKPGVAHAEDVNYIWRSTENGDTQNENDMTMRRRLTRLWTNFAKTSDPTPCRDDLLENIQWPATDPETLTHLDIGPNLTISDKPEFETFNFWDSLYRKYGNPPYDTY